MPCDMAKHRGAILCTKFVCKPPSPYITHQFPNLLLSHRNAHYDVELPLRQTMSHGNTLIQP